MSELETKQYIPDWTNFVEYVAGLEAEVAPGDAVDRKGIWWAWQACLPVDLRLKSDGTYAAYFGGDIGLVEGTWSESDSVLRLQAPSDAMLGGLPRDENGSLLLRRQDEHLLIETPGLAGGLPIVLVLVSTETCSEAPRA